MIFLVDALSAYRLTRLAIKDTLTEPLRFKVKRAAMNAPVDDGIAAKLQTLLECPWCFSVYVAIGVVAARRFAPKAWQPVAEVLALSTVVGLIAEHYD